MQSHLPAVNTTFLDGSDMSSASASASPSPSPHASETGASARRHSASPPPMLPLPNVQGAYTSYPPLHRDTRTESRPPHSPIQAPGEQRAPRTNQKQTALQDAPPRGGDRRSPQSPRESSASTLYSIDHSREDGRGRARSPRQPHHRQVEAHTVPPMPTIKRSSSISPMPLKRKRDGSIDSDFGYFSGRAMDSEFEKGYIVCEHCRVQVQIREGNSGSFTMKHWEAHRGICPSSPALSSPPPAKRRRAKRTEQERIDYLKSDPYVRDYEAYRVLCKSCDKWIRLRPNSTYCSIPWDAHRKSCLSKKITSKNTYALEQRNKSLERDPNVRKFDAERVLCALCDAWIMAPVSDARDLWAAHKVQCRMPTLSSNAGGSVNVIPLTHQGPPPLSSVPLTPAPQSPQSPAAAPSTSQRSEGSQHPNLSRRRNAEQRAATLRADPLILHVEENRVFCSLCQKWVQLRQDSTYCAYPWVQHRGKCLMRSQKRQAKHLAPRNLRASMDAESEDAEGSWDEEEPSVGQHHGRPPPGAPASMHAASSHHVVHPPPAVHTYASSHPTDSYLDLDSTNHRLTHLGLSLSHLLRTTFRAGVPVGAVLSFMNASMPEDRWEEYDMREIAKGVGILVREGIKEGGDRMLRIELEGDMVRPR